CDAETQRKAAGLIGRRLLRVQAPGEHGEFVRTTTPIKGPAPSDPDGHILLTTNMNSYGLAPLEWSNALAYVLPHAGEKVKCDFSKANAWEEQQPFVDKKDAAKELQNPDPAERPLFDVKLEVRPFFEDDTAVISKALAQAGELTQGLCSPWQNDYRECSCYYWASARPDFVNVEIDGNGLSAGDNWFQRKRTGSYVPDDYADSRLVMYDELFRDWEKVLKFQVEGRDWPRPPDDKGSGKNSEPRRVIGTSAPRAPQAHLIETELGRHLFVADGSRLFDAGPEIFAGCDAVMARGETGALDDLLRRVGLDGEPFIDDTPLEPPPVRALSLAIAQKCNLGCAYCYAEQGDFGAAPKNMSTDDALRAVDLLIEAAEPGAPLNLAFLGGEPLVNRPALRQATAGARTPKLAAPKSRFRSPPTARS